MRIFNPTEEAQLENLALNTWGLESQLDMVVEECAELILAIEKSRRRDNRNHSIPEELADVQNCINQIKKLYPEFENIRQSKLNRMAILLKEDVNSQVRNSNQNIFENLEYIPN